jgi:Fic family protein
MDAERSLGRLQGLLEGTDWPQGLLRLTALQEAAASARLEGGHFPLSDLLWWELDGRVNELRSSTGALRLASQHAEMLLNGPETLAQDLESLHQGLYRNVRGRDGQAGKLRTSLIWLGPKGSTAQDAPYVPPAPEQLRQHVDGLSDFLTQASAWPRVVHAALSYYQVESLQPFLDGSGRIARILLVNSLAGKDAHSSAVLLRPSLLWTKNTAEHFGQLQMLREHGSFEEWISVFSKSIEQSCSQALELMNRVTSWFTQTRRKISDQLPNQRQIAMAILSALPGQPLLSIESAANLCNRNFANANIVVQRLVGLGLLREITGRKRNRRFVAPSLMLALEEEITP